MLSSLVINGAIFAALAAQAAPDSTQAILDQIDRALESEHQDLIATLRYDLRQLADLPALPDRTELAGDLLAELRQTALDTSSATPLMDEALLSTAIRLLPEIDLADAQRLQRQITDEFGAAARFGDVDDLAGELRTTWPVIAETGQTGFGDALGDSILQGLAERNPMAVEDDWWPVEHRLLIAEIRTDLGDVDGARAGTASAVDLFLASDSPHAYYPLFLWSRPWDDDFLGLLERVRASGDARHLARFIESPGDDDQLLAAVERRLSLLSNTGEPLPSVESAYDQAIVWGHLDDLIAHERYVDARRVAIELTQTMRSNWRAHAALAQAFLAIGDNAMAGHHGRYVASLITLNAPDPRSGNGDAYEHAWTAYWSNVSQPHGQAWQTAHALLDAGRVDGALDIVLASLNEERFTTAALQNRRLVRFLDEVKTPLARTAFLDALWTLGDEQSSLALEVATLELAASLRAPQRNAEEIRLAAVYYDGLPAAWVSPQAKQLLLQSAWAASSRIESYSDTASRSERLRARVAILAALSD